MLKKWTPLQSSLIKGDRVAMFTTGQGELTELESECIWREEKRERWRGSTGGIYKAIRDMDREVGDMPLR